MPSIGRQFRKGGVPRSAEALRALGMDVGEGDPTKREEDVEEIKLTEAELKATESEPRWTEVQLDQWVGTLGLLPEEAQSLKRSLVFEEHEGQMEIHYQGHTLDLSGSLATELPPYLVVSELKISDTSVERIPAGIVVNTLTMGRTYVREISSDLKARDIWTDRESHDRLRNQFNHLDPQPRITLV